MILQWLLDSHVGIDEQCQDGATALHGAALGKHKGAIKLLLQKGAKKDVKNHQKQTVMEESPEIMKEVLKELENPSDENDEGEEEEDDEDDASLKNRVNALEWQVAAQNKEIQELKKKQAGEIQELKKAVAALLNKK